MGTAKPDSSAAGRGLEQESPARRGKQPGVQNAGTRKARPFAGAKTTKDVVMLQRLQSQFKALSKEFAEANDTAQQVESELGDLRKQVASTVRQVGAIAKARAQITAETQAIRRRLDELAAAKAAAEKPQAPLPAPGLNLPPHYNLPVHTAQQALLELAARLGSQASSAGSFAPLLAPQPGPAEKGMMLEDLAKAPLPAAEQPSQTVPNLFDAALRMPGMPGPRPPTPAAFPDLQLLDLPLLGLEDYPGFSLNGAPFPAPLETFHDWDPARVFLPDLR